MGKAFEINREKFLEYYNLGYGERKIAKELNCSRTRIYTERLKLGLPPNLVKSKVSINVLEDLVSKGLSDKQIVEIVGSNVANISSLRIRHIGKKSKEVQYSNQKDSYNYFDIFSDPQQLAILCGTIIGDGSLRNGSFNSARGSISHKESSKDYLVYKQKLLKDISMEKLKYIITKESFINGRRVWGENQFTLRTKSSPSLEKLRKIIYCGENGGKKITEELLALMNENSLAMHFFDDGSKRIYTARPNFYTYQIAMYGFDNDSIQLYIDWLKKSFNIEAKNHSGILYVKAKSREIFKEIISKHTVNSMMYKI